MYAMLRPGGDHDNGGRSKATLIKYPPRPPSVRGVVGALTSWQAANSVIGVCPAAMAFVMHPIMRIVDGWWCFRAVSTPVSSMRVPTRNRDSSRRLLLSKVSSR